jgi:hypothetical protein
VEIEPEHREGAIAVSAICGAEIAGLARDENARVYFTL